MKPITAQDRGAALGRLFRGIVHETSNWLNVILMNAQLAEASPEDTDTSLKTISTQARSGGDFLKQLSAFAGASSFNPHTRATIAECVALARNLLGSTARRTGTRLVIGACDTTPRLLDTTGLGITLGLLFDALCQLEADEINVHCEGNATVTIVVAANELEWPLAEQDGSLSVRMAHAFCRDHGGELVQSTSQWRLKLPSPVSD
ncbi:MAG: hypothetical protein HKN49_12430 [Gammaproteobacteria bacterium]|nr:hypothetical protein [Gammaproteobacteria bacterium]